MPEALLTVSLHHLVVEADREIDYVGPIREAMASWIERICFDVVEPTKRRFLFRIFKRQKHFTSYLLWTRRLCNAPEKTIIRQFLIRHYMQSNYYYLPKLEDFQNHDTSPPQDRDIGTPECKVALFWLNWQQRTINSHNLSTNQSINVK